jgi:hypothetical protein
MKISIPRKTYMTKDAKENTVDMKPHIRGNKRSSRSFRNPHINTTSTGSMTGSGIAGNQP